MFSKCFTECYPFLFVVVVVVVVVYLISFLARGVIELPVCVVAAFIHNLQNYPQWNKFMTVSYGIIKIHVPFRCIAGRKQEQY